MFLFQIVLSRLISKFSLISRSNLLSPLSKIVNSSKDEILLQFKKWSRIAPYSDGLVFLNVKGHILPNMFSRLFHLSVLLLSTLYPLLILLLSFVLNTIWHSNCQHYFSKDYFDTIQTRKSLLEGNIEHYPFRKPHCWIIKILSTILFENRIVE